MASLLVRSGVRPAARLLSSCSSSSSSSAATAATTASNATRGVSSIAVEALSVIASLSSHTRSSTPAISAHFERLVARHRPSWHRMHSHAFASSAAAMQSASSSAAATAAAMASSSRTSSSSSTSTSSSYSTSSTSGQSGSRANSSSGGGRTNSGGSGSGGSDGGGARNTSASTGAVAARARRGSSGSSDITDQIPVRPVGVVEGASYTVVIVAGVACAAAVLYAAASELLGSPIEYAAFSAALERARDDPRVAVRLGSPVTGYGQEAKGRAARQRIPHRVRTDEAGVEHVQVQFWARGPGGAARVTAEMFQRPVEVGSGKKEWAYDYMVADFEQPRGGGRVMLVAPGSDSRR